LDLPTDHPDVQSETLRIKIEKNITLTYDEELIAQSLQLLPPVELTIADDGGVVTDDTVLQ
jgi:hypothetical protein